MYPVVGPWREGFNGPKFYRLFEGIKRNTSTRVEGWIIVMAPAEHLKELYDST